LAATFTSLTIWETPPVPDMQIVIITFLSKEIISRRDT
jgi:hypothetical protein